MVWSATATFVPLALLIALYARIAHLDRSIPFAILAVILAAAFGGATEILARRESRPGLMISTALFATGTLGALALALTFALEKGWLTIALALMSMGTAWISMQRPIPFLRSLAAILAGIVVLRIGYEPRIVGDAVGTTPIFNWLLVGLRHSRGIVLDRRAPSCAAASTMRRCASSSRPRSCSPCCWCSWRSATRSMAATSITSRRRWRSSRCEVCVALAMAIGLERLRLRTNSIVHNIGAVAAHGDSPASSACSGCCCWRTRILTTVQLDGGFINLLLLAYALPAVLMLLLAYAAVGRRGAPYANTIAAGALIFALAYVTLEIRRLYHGPVITVGDDQRRRAIHLFDRLAGLRRRAARHRHPRQLRSAPGWRRRP